MLKSKRLSRRKSRLVLRYSILHGESSSLFGDDPSRRFVHLAFTWRLPLQFVQNSWPFFKQTAYSLTMVFVMPPFLLVLCAPLVDDLNDLS